MADPITTLDLTESVSDLLTTIGLNFDVRLWNDNRTVTASSVTVGLTDEWILVDPTSNAITLNLPAVATCDGMVLVVTALNVANTITLDGSGAETINGSATKTIGTSGRTVVLRAYSGGWRANYFDAL